MKTLTVAVPCYNSQDYMGKCIESLLAGGAAPAPLAAPAGSSDRTDGDADCDLMCRWIRRTDSRFLRWDLLSLPNGSSETFCGSCS